MVADAKKRTTHQYHTTTTTSTTTADELIICVSRHQTRSKNYENDNLEDSIMYDKVPIGLVR